MPLKKGKENIFFSYENFLRTIAKKQEKKFFLRSIENSNFAMAAFESIRIKSYKHFRVGVSNVNHKFIEFGEGQLMRVTENLVMRKFSY